MNAQSSRSHAIFTLHIVQQRPCPVVRSLIPRPCPVVRSLIPRPCPVVCSLIPKPCPVVCSLIPRPCPVVYSLIPRPCPVVHSLIPRPCPAVCLLATLVGAVSVALFPGFPRFFLRFAFSIIHKSGRVARAKSRECYCQKNNSRRTRSRECCCCS